jgi:methylmalonyl-CoA/ethylmalonyl-CoA epimerase
VASVITGLRQVAQRAPDLGVSVPFYRDVLGLTHQATFEPPGLAFFDLGDGTRLLLDANASVTAAILYFAVEDIHAACTDLAGSGVALEAEPHLIHRHDGTFDDEGVEEWMAFFRDPAGNVLAFASRVAPSS